MKVLVDLDRWYAHGNLGLSSFKPNYQAMLLNSQNQCCCLGFCAAAHDAGDLFGRPTPAALSRSLSPHNWMLDVYHDNSDLAYLAMEINDAHSISNWDTQPLEVRMGNLITIFAEGGDELEFFCSSES